jgi:hypothetical protein
MGPRGDPKTDSHVTVLRAVENRANRWLREGRRERTTSRITISSPVAIPTPRNTPSTKPPLTAAPADQPEGVRCGA